MSNYLLDAIGINTVLVSVLRTQGCNDNQKAAFLSGFVAESLWDFLQHMHLFY